MSLKDAIISIPDYPKKGVIFRDVTGILNDPKEYSICNNLLYDLSEMFIFDSVAGLESRGFIFGSVLAYEHACKFIPVRKAGKLPRETVKASYDLEYGSATIEIHKDSISPGERVLIVDDILATGGTANATADLIESLGGIVAGVLCVVELPELKGREIMMARGIPVRSLVEFEGE